MRAAAICAAGLVLAMPLPAAAQDAGEVRAGAFAGARISLSLGGREARRAPRIGLALSPMLSREGADGRRRIVIGEGAALDLAGGSGPRLTIGGRRIASFGPGGDGPEIGRRQGISTLGAVAIGVGVAVIVGAALFYDALGDASE